MLNRRFLRVKVLQALFAYFSDQDEAIGKYERDMLQSFERLRDLYALLLYFFVELHEIAVNKIEEGKKKQLPSPEDLNPNTRFIDNKALKALSESKSLLYYMEERKLGWGDDRDLIRDVMKKVSESDFFLEYMKDEETGWNTDIDLLLRIFEEFIQDNERILDLFEEESIYWVDDMMIASLAMGRSLRGLSKEKGLRMEGLFKDPSDKDFAIDLFRKTALNADRFEEMIVQRTSNWEKDRIALMDMILMKMALSEFLYAETVPVKVTLNEYIELSKEYSTEKSKMFINGVLDKLINDLKKDGSIRKMGRGLIG
jgi:N utilization substance protein B